MSKWKWMLAISCIVALTVWYFLFYTSYSNRSIPGNADLVLAVDIKKNTRSVLYYYITHPSEWRLGSIFSTRDKSRTPDWRDAIKVPDYVFVFHVKGQPPGVFYSLLTIKKEAAFQRALTAYDFKIAFAEKGHSVYYSDKLGIGLVKKNNQLLAGYLGPNDSLLLRAVATDIFIQNEFIEKDTLEKITRPSNHFTAYIQKNKFLKEDVLLNGHFFNGRLQLEASIHPRGTFLMNEAEFDIPQHSLGHLVFTQPLPAVYALVPTTVKTKLSTAFNFDIDSLFVQGNKKYALDIESIKQKTDSAVSYAYDDNFNKIEKVVVNQIQEPSFNFMVMGGQPSRLLNYWTNNKNIENDGAGNLFTPIPFVKTYAVAGLMDTLSLMSANYRSAKPGERVTCIGSLHIRFNRLPPNVSSYLPDLFGPVVKKMAALNITSKKHQQAINIALTLTAKNTGKPFLLCFD